MIKTLSLSILFLSLVLACSKNEAPKASAAPANVSTKSSISPETEKSIVDAYKTWAIAQSSEFLSLNTDFTKALTDGDYEKAKSIYPKARMPFERIEPVAEALGEFDPKLDAREGDVPVASWTGFHAIEKILWQSKDYAKIKALASDLLNNVKLLRAQIETAELSLKSMIAGSVELLNEISTSKLTGEEDRYSHTDLYDIYANFEGSSLIYGLLSNVVKAKDAGLATTIDQRIAEFEKILSSFKTKDGFKSFETLTKEEIKSIAQSTDGLAAALSQSAKILE